MARRRLTIKRLDPWSVLKFGALANLALLGIFLLFLGVVWFIVERLQLIDQVCGIATDIGFTTCGVEAGEVFRAFALLGALWVVIQTAVFVFFAFLHNLIADLTGGLVVGVVDDTPVAPASRAAAVPARTDERDAGSRSGRQRTSTAASEATPRAEPARRAEPAPRSQPVPGNEPERREPREPVRAAGTAPTASAAGSGGKPATSEGARSPAPARSRRRREPSDDDLFADR